MWNSPRLERTWLVWACFAMLAGKSWNVWNGGRWCFCSYLSARSSTEAQHVSGAWMWIGVRPQRITADQKGASAPHLSQNTNATGCWAFCVICSWVLVVHILKHIFEHLKIPILKMWTVLLLHIDLFLYGRTLNKVLINPYILIYLLLSSLFVNMLLTTLF